MRALIAWSVLSSLPIATFLQEPPTRTLSRPQVEYPEPFIDIGAIRELRDERVIVVDSRDLTVKLLDFRVGTTTTIGRSGQGPGEYRMPGRLYPIPGDSTLLHDNAGGRLMIVQPDGKPGGFFDPNRLENDTVLARARRFFVRTADTRGFLYGELQPVRVGANGALELTDHAAIERFNYATRARDTVALWPMRRDASARLMDGMVLTQPRMHAFPAWEHWVVAPDGRIAFVFFDPYRVDFVGGDRRVTRNPPIPYERVRVDDALKQQYREEQQRPGMAMVLTRGGGSTVQSMRRPFREPTEWPEFLPPFLGTSVFAPDGLLWIPRTTPAGRPQLYDIVNGRGAVIERVELPPRTKLVGFGASSVYIVRLDADDLQYLQRYALPTTARP